MYKIVYKTYPSKTESSDKKSFIERIKYIIIFNYNGEIKYERKL